HGREGMRIARQDGDAIARRDATRRQTVGDAVAYGIELPICPTDVPAYDGCLAGEACRGAAQQVAQRMLARGCVRVVRNAGSVCRLDELDGHVESPFFMG